MLSADVPGDPSRRFVVTWRNRSTGTTHRVGNLSLSSDQAYRYTYVEGAALVPGFRPFLGFPDVHKEYESRRLWALFSLRAMDP